MTFTEMKREMLAVTGAADDGWTVGADGVLVCPCGHRVEDDGECPNGHESPMRAAGLI